MRSVASEHRFRRDAPTCDATRGPHDRSTLEGRPCSEQPRNGRPRRWATDLHGDRGCTVLCQPRLASGANFAVPGNVVTSRDGRCGADIVRLNSTGGPVAGHRCFPLFHRCGPICGLSAGSRGENRRWYSLRTCGRPAVTCSDRRSRMRCGVRRSTTPRRWTSPMASSPSRCRTRWSRPHRRNLRVPGPRLSARCRGRDARPGGPGRRRGPGRRPGRRPVHLAPRPRRTVERPPLASRRPRPSRPPLPSTPRANPPGDDDRYTFDAFVTGPSNRFAHAAALAVAETPGRSLQPAVHLRRRRPGQDPPAAGHRPLRPRELPGLPGALRLDRDLPERVRRRHPHRTPGRRSSAATATSTCCWSTTSSSSRARKGLQEEFFHTFNALHEANRQIVLSSDRPPDAIADPRGPAAQPVQDGPDHRHPAARPRDPPGHPPQEGRARDRRHVPDDVLEFIATNITDNIRELEGALIRVSAYASLTHEPLDRRRWPSRCWPTSSATASPGRSRRSVILEATVGDVRVHRSRTSRARAGAGRSSPPARSACTSSAS